MSSDKRQSLHGKVLRQCSYTEAFEQMKAFTDQRSVETDDELWLVEHQPVFTQGQAGKPEHILESSSIPIVQSDRGGQVTYHGPGQIVLYCLIDLKRKGLNVRQCVSKLEEVVIKTLLDLGIDSHLKDKAPGVYVDGKKIASLGLRVRKGCTYHGLSLNVDMDLSPFLLINPCGYQGLEMIQVKDCVPQKNQNLIADVEKTLIGNFAAIFDYDASELASLLS